MLSCLLMVRFFKGNAYSFVNRKFLLICCSKMQHPSFDHFVVCLLWFSRTPFLSPISLQIALYWVAVVTATSIIYNYTSQIIVQGTTYTRLQSQSPYDVSTDLIILTFSFTPTSNFNYLFMGHDNILYSADCVGSALFIVT